ncbi:MAG: hypothetical protein LIO37_03410 [Clostridiales bacterium]|nr:hypothetical protein [Clostridiales bacterium]
MNKKVTGIVAYLTVIGLIIAFVAGDREGAKFHLNQALVLWIVGVVGGLISYIPLVGGIISAIVSIFCFICWILGLIHAVQEEEKPLPLIGAIKLLN